ncbi:MAG TPA: hypothetical protein VF796_09745, partial [Humisphaera sp.]
MQRIGTFELLRELDRRPTAVLYAARKAGDKADAAGRYAFKAFDVESVDLLASVAATQTFLDRATKQKSLVDKGARHWAAVHEVGTAEQPYYVTDLFPMTAERFYNRGAVASSRALYTIVWSVVRALTELREGLRRAHGNLKPSNVLIDGDLKLHSPRTTRVVLTDMVGEGTTARDRAGDLLAVGELVHLLVLRRPFRPTAPELAVSEVSADAETIEYPPAAHPEWPVPMSANWARLGPDGQRWLDLCNWLLSPDPSKRPGDLVEVAVALHALTPKRRPVRKRWVAAAVVPLVLAGAAAAWFHHRHAAARAEYLAARGQWFESFAARMQDPVRQERYAVDPGLRAVVDAFRAARRDGVRFDVTADDPLLSYGNYRSATGALAVVREAERDLTPERWPTLANVEAAGRRYEARGWQQPALFLADLARGARPGGDRADVAGGIDRLLAVWSRAEPAAEVVEARWRQYDADLAAARRANDPVLTRFADHLAAAAGSAVRLTDTGFEGTDGITARAPLAAALAKLAAGGWPGTHDRKRLAAELEPTLNADRPGDEDVRRWVEGVDQYALVTLEPKAEPLAGLRKAFDQVTKDVARQSVLSDEEKGQYDADRSAAERKIADLGSTRFVRKDVVRAAAVGPIAVRADEIGRDLEKLRRQWVRMDDPKEWLAFVGRALPSNSDVLRQRWQAYVAAQQGKLAAFQADPPAFKRAKAQAEAVREALADTGRQFPLGAEGLGEELSAAAFERRESILKDLSGWADPAGPAGGRPPTAEQVEQTVKAGGEAYAAWCEKLKALAKDFPITREVLTPADRPDKKWLAADPAFWTDPAVQKYVRKDLARLEALAAVATMSRAQLVAAAEKVETLEVAAAAYKRLGEPAAGAPAWPATPAELQTELDLRNGLAKRINAVTQSTG